MMNLERYIGWENFLSGEMQKEYYQKIKEKIALDINSGETIYPDLENVFYAFSQTSLDNLKVVILGQDPYHGENQANGLSFSVSKGQKLPPSLKNIYKELENDLGIKQLLHGDLTNWAKSGVLLLNAILTVQKSKPASHQNIGWEIFSDNTIKYINENKSGIVFILWGNFAKSKMNLIDLSKNFVITSPHPSPFSAHNGFFGSKPFSKCNEILKKIGKPQINWEI